MLLRLSLKFLGSWSVPPQPPQSWDFHRVLPLGDCCYQLVTAVSWQPRVLSPVYLGLFSKDTLAPVPSHCFQLPGLHAEEKPLLVLVNKLPRAEPLPMSPIWEEDPLLYRGDQTLPSLARSPATAFMVTVPQFSPVGDLGSPSPSLPQDRGLR